MRQDASEGQFHKDDIVTVTIEDIGTSGEGIGHADMSSSAAVPESGPAAAGHRRGFALFIKDAVPGDTVRAKIMKVKKGYGYARLLEVTEPSPFRVSAKCPAARPCGGCQIQELSYEQQLAYKFRKVREDLIRIGGFAPELTDTVLQPIVGMEEPWRFRNKAQFPVGERDGRPIVGFYAGRTHHIVPADDCMIGAPENAAIVRTVLEYMRCCHVSAYDEMTGEGLVRHILIRSGFLSGEIMVCLVINAARLPQEETLVRMLRDVPLPAQQKKTPDTLQEDCPAAAERLDAEVRPPASRIVSICLNSNCEKTNVVLGRRNRTLWGKDSIEDSLRILDVTEGSDSIGETAVSVGERFTVDERCTEGTENVSAAAGEKRPDVVFTESGRSVSFSISPLSFYQVNPRQTERLYSLVRHYAGLNGREVVWDLYCGVGTISCFLARDAKSVYGVEVIPDAIRDARENARRNGLTNVTFEVGKAEEVLPAFVQAGNRHVDVVVVDPPRRGCERTCLDTILEAAPKRIVYVSCDPATLARDLAVLTAGGYTVQAIRPVDMFPHSVHVETCVLLSNHNRKPDAVVRMSLDMDEYYRIVDEEDQGK